MLSNLAQDGGAEAQSIELARALKARGWNISVVSMMAPKEGAELLEADGIPLHTLDAAGGNFARPMLRLTRLLRQERPHILHCHMSHAVLAARLARRIPVVIGTLHGLKARKGLTDWLSDVTTVVCGAAAEQYLATRAISRDGLRVIPNGIATERFRPNPILRQHARTALGVNGEFVWIMARRFQLVSDHHSLLRAFARVVSQSPRSVLLLAGSGPLQGELEELARGMGIGSRVRFLGTRTDIPALMNAADACVLSSVVEAMPMALLEAGATGLPSVTTDIGGTSDIVIHGHTGFLTPPSNPEALANAMLRLADLPALVRQRMGEQARRHVKSHFGMEEVVGQWESLYHEMLAKKEVRL